MCACVWCMTRSSLHLISVAMVAFPKQGKKQPKKVWCGRGVVIGCGYRVWL